VQKSITINGPGSDNLAVDGNHASRVFNVRGGVIATISGLTITNGSVSGNAGGGIYNDHSTLTVSNCTLTGNSSDFVGGGIDNDGHRNDVFGGSATLTVTNSRLSGNSAGVGGGIYNDGYSGSATLTVIDTTVNGNAANVLGGGGISNYGASGSGTVTVTNSTLSGNSAVGYGAGIFNFGHSGSATLTVTNSTLSGNSATSLGGGIYNEGAESGSAMLTVANSTLSGNSATYNGGGIYNYGYLGSATTQLGNAIFNASSLFNYSGTITSLGYNVSNDDGGGFLTAAGDQINTDPMLGPLQDNGGPTFTHELLNGSPAIDAGDPNFTPPPNYDQRGSDYDRVANSRLDIGAFEVQTSPTPTPTPTATPTATPTSTATPTPTPTPAYAAQVQPPINPDGSSTFNVRRGVVPVRFNLTQGGVATCDLPPATIAVTRTAGGVIGQVNESDYSGNVDTGSNFRIGSCQYVYNLNARALGVGTYRVDILINGQVVGSATFGLN
jgi:hypothetical protein